MFLSLPQLHVVFIQGGGSDGVVLPQIRRIAIAIGGLALIRWLVLGTLLVGHSCLGF